MYDKTEKKKTKHTMLCFAFTAFNYNVLTLLSFEFLGMFVYYIFSVMSALLHESLL